MREQIDAARFPQTVYPFVLFIRAFFTCEICYTGKIMHTLISTFLAMGKGMCCTDIVYIIASVLQHCQVFLYFFVRNHATVYDSSTSFSYRSLTFGRRLWGVD
jgi:hypothetical protein